MLAKIRADALQKSGAAAPPTSSSNSSAAASSILSTNNSTAPVAAADTYEISDRESDDDSDSDADEKPRKRVPDWARSVNLIPALERQFCDAANRVDPDSIFPEVQSCDLEDIFEQKKMRYNRRTSSGNWTKDQITQVEKRTYRKEMGFNAKAGNAV